MSLSPGVSPNLDQLARSAADLVKDFKVSDLSNQLVDEYSKLSPNDYQIFLNKALADNKQDRASDNSLPGLTIEHRSNREDIIVSAENGISKLARPINNQLADFVRDQYAALTIAGPQSNIEAVTGQALIAERGSKVYVYDYKDVYALDGSRVHAANSYVYGRSGSQVELGLWANGKFEDGAKLKMNGQPDDQKKLANF
jgi:hypothetical protein